MISAKLSNCQNPQCLDYFKYLLSITPSLLGKNSETYEEFTGCYMYLLAFITLEILAANAKFELAVDKGQLKSYYLPTTILVKYYYITMGAKQV